MAKTERNKEIQALTLSKDVRVLLKQQAEREGVSISQYVERIILKKQWEWELAMKNSGNSNNGGS